MTKSDEKHESHHEPPKSLAEDAYDFKVTEQATEFRKEWMWLLVVICLALLAGVITIIILSMEYTNQSIPSEIDVVLYEKAGEGDRILRHTYQAKALVKYMSWVNKIYILSSTHSGYNEELQATYVSFAGTDEQGFEYMPKIPGISSHAIYLSDRTFPMKPIQKTFFYTYGYSRLFNLFRDQSEVTFFQNYMELPTMPSFVADMSRLSDYEWVTAMWREVSEGNVILRNDMNRDLMIVGSEPENAELQFNATESAKPLFFTLHVGSINDDASKTAANTLINSQLEKWFP